MSEGSMEKSLNTSHLAGGNLCYLDDLYEDYLLDPNSVPNEWRQYFDSLPRVEGTIVGDVPHSTSKNSFYSSEKIGIVPYQPVSDLFHLILTINRSKSSASSTPIESGAISVPLLIHSG